MTTSHTENTAHTENTVNMARLVYLVMLASEKVIAQNNYGAYTIVANAARRQVKEYTIGELSEKTFARLARNFAHWMDSEARYLSEDDAADFASLAEKITGAAEKVI